MPAIEVSASIFCARDSWRGSESMASTVALRAASCCISSGFCAGQMKPISVAAFAHQADFVRARGAHLEDDVRSGPEFGRRRHDLGAGGAVGVVGEVRGVARAAFHGHREAQLDELLDHVGHGGDALFSQRRLLGHADQEPLRDPWKGSVEGRFRVRLATGR